MSLGDGSFFASGKPYGIWACGHLRDVSLCNFMCMVIDVSLFSGVERQFYGFLGIFLVQDDMVVYLYDHLLVVAQQLRNLFDGNGGYLVAQVHAVVVTKDVRGQIRGLHLLPGCRPRA